MRFLIDANLPRSLLGLLVELGHAAELARDIGLAAATDAEVAAHARNAGAALLTRDLDFADVRRYPPEQYSGIVVLRLSDHTTAQGIVEVVGRFLAETDFVTSLTGRLAIVEANQVRFRPPLA